MYSNADRNKSLWSYMNGVFTNELSEDSQQLESQPDHIKPRLFIHQRTLLASALHLESTKFSGLDCGQNKRLYTNFGVLADRVGSGKSLTALALTKMPVPADREINTIQRNNCISMIQYSKTEDKKRRVKAALFIIPHSLMGQWEDYVTKDSTLNVIFCRKRKEASDKSIIDHFDQVDAVFISSTMWKYFEDTIRPDTLHWSRIFVDEADSIQIPIRTALTANFTWLITASYLNIAFPTGMYLHLNSPYYAHDGTLLTPALLETIKKISGNEFRVEGAFTNSSYIKNIIGATDVMQNAELQSWRVILRNADNFVNMSFAMPPVNHAQIICKAPANIRILESVIPNEIMEMLHAGDTRGALQSLGVHDESPTSIIASLTQTLRKDLEQQQKRLDFYKTLDYSSEASKQKSLETQEQKIVSLVSRIETIEKRMSEVESTNCPICYSDVETPTMTPCCKNLFCFVCVCESLKRQPVCPLCRADITSVNNLRVISKTGNTIEPVQQIKQRTKVEEFIHFVENNPKAKILLFSGYDATFFQLTSEMTHRNINFTTINGSTARVSKIINEFDSGNYRVLLLNSRHVGSGLNIICATDVFLFHKMSSEMEKQIIGRAYRMGRTQPLNVHHLLHPSEATSA
jgi:hypothetical protein